MDRQHQHGTDETPVDDGAMALHRGDIDRIDRTITALLSERMRIGQALGRLKRLRAQPARSESREADVLLRVRAAAVGPLSPTSAERIFLTIIEETAACQERDAREEYRMPDTSPGSKGPKVRHAKGPVAYQGAPGAFSEDAATQLCGTGAVLHPCRMLEDVFHALERGDAAAAVIPVENSTAGDVPGSRELIARYQLRTIKTLALPIVHALVAATPIAVDDVREVHSHPMALAQCQRFISAHPHMRSVPAFDTSGALAELMRHGSRRAAAIASRRAAAHWGGVVLQDAIQDRADNITEFWLVTPFD